MGKKQPSNGGSNGSPNADQMTVRKRAAFIKAIADSPDNVALALRKAGLPVSLTSQAEAWDETILARHQIREALDRALLNADYIAEKLKFHAASENPFISLRAINLVAKLRGYYDPIPKSIPTSPNLDPLAAELRKRDRIVEVIGLRSYPLPPEENRSSKGLEEHQSIGTDRGMVEAGTPPHNAQGGEAETGADDWIASPPGDGTEFEGEVGGEEA